MNADKKIIRFFRKNFNKKHYENFRSAYLAICEINSDFGGEHIPNFTKTVAEYAGKNIDTIRPYLAMLKEAGIIDYAQQMNKDGKFAGTVLSLNNWKKDVRSKIKLVTKERNLK